MSVNLLKYMIHCFINSALLVFPLPSGNQAAQSKFAEIAEAYEILSDDSTREMYDHARRVHAATRRYHRGSGSSADFSEGARGIDDDDEWVSTPWFQQYADGMGVADDGMFFGSSFESGDLFDTGFWQGSFHGGGGGMGAGGDGGSGGMRFEFRPRDPMELFDVRDAEGGRVL